MQQRQVILQLYDEDGSRYEVGDSGDTTGEIKISSFDKFGDLDNFVLVAGRDFTALVDLLVEYEGLRTRPKS